jgi:MinD superfamily P-loop ATPase
MKPDQPLMNKMTCHGCRRCLYTAPGGQAWNREPHSRCVELNVDVPMILGEHDKWVGSKVPSGCPEFAQPNLF